MTSVVDQLVDIYYKHEPWHVFKMPPNMAQRYHATRYKSGEIEVYEEDGQVLGYYQRHFVGHVCFLDNAWIKPDKRHGRVFKALYRRFFETMPAGISHIIGERGTKLHKVKTRRK